MNTIQNSHASKWTQQRHLLVLYARDHALIACKFEQAFCSESWRIKKSKEKSESESEKYCKATVTTK